MQLKLLYFMPILLLISETKCFKSATFLKTKGIGESWFLLVSKNSGKCADVRGGRQDAGADILQYDCHGGANQQFQPIVKEDQTVLLRIRHSGRVLDVSGGARHNGASFIQWDKHEGPNQRFRIQPAGEVGYFFIINVNSGKCFDVDGVSRKDMV